MATHRQAKRQIVAPLGSAEATAITRSNASRYRAHGGGPALGALNGAVRASPSTVAGQMFEGVLVHLSLLGADGTPVTVTLSNDGQTPHLAPGAPLRVYFAPAHASVLPAGRSGDA